MVDKKKLFNTIMILLFVALVGYLYFGIQYRNNLMKDENVNYTIGNVIDYEFGAKVAPWFTFNFYVDEKIWEGEYSINDTLRRKSSSYLKRKYIGKKFFVKYSIIKPKFNELYLYKPVPDSLLDCVKCAWEEPPF